MIKIFVLLLSLSVFAVEHLVVPNSFQDSAIITATPFNQNFDSLASGTNRFADTVNAAFNGTKTIDSLTVTGIKGRLTGNVKGNVTGNCSGTAATVTGAAQSAITSVGTLTSLVVSGTAIVDSLKSTKQVQANLKGNVTGNVTSSGTSTFDSTYSRTITANGNIQASVSSGSVSLVAATTAANQGGALSLKGVATTEGQTLSTVSGYNNENLIGALRIKRGNADNTGKLYIHTTIAGVEKEIMATNSAGDVVFNDGGDARDFRVEASGDAYAIKLSGATAKIGIGTVSPTEKLHVSGNIKADTLKGAVQGNIVGNVIGNVTGNCSGTAATVTGAAQTAITSLGTISNLTSSGTRTINGQSRYAFELVRDTIKLNNNQQIALFSGTTGDIVNADVTISKRSPGGIVGIWKKRMNFQFTSGAPTIYDTTTTSSYSNPSVASPRFATVGSVSTIGYTITSYDASDTSRYVFHVTGTILP